MAVYWLVPVEQEDPLVLGADRISIGGGAAPDHFRAKLHRIHPRLLPMVKASILPGDPDEEADLSACGAGSDLPLHENVPLAFDGTPHVLSECGRAFIDRLPLLREQMSLLDAAVGSSDDDWTAEEREWLKLLLSWNETGRKAMLLKED
jgi:hypothetical protein